MNDTLCLHFEVLSGLYCGLTGKLAPETNIIGSGLDADLIFVEQGLASHHLRITLLANSIEVEALAAGLDVKGSGNIAAGEVIVVPLPVVIDLGAMSILWSAQGAAPAGSSGTPRHSIPVLAFVLLGSVGIGALSAICSYYGSAGASSVNAPDVRLESKLTHNLTDNQTTVAAAKDLQQEVDRAGLLNIKIGSAKGVVTAEGTVTSASATSWQHVQQWFDHHTKGALTLVNGVITKEEKAPSAIAVEAVWRGPLPYIVIDGEKYFVGSLLDDGWTVDRIEDSRVLLSRNGRLAFLPY
ncbi:SctD/MshK family protein [Bradyrhizobium sp. Arg314]